MPYIPYYERLESFLGKKPETAGQLNYLITTIILAYAKKAGNYQGINDILGALEGAKLEFYRRYASPYEDSKIAANGDVYNNDSSTEEVPSDNPNKSGAV